MKKNGVTHVVWLPDSETNFLYQLMEADPSLTLGRSAARGSRSRSPPGSSTGGQTPIILIQNTGLMESGDSLRGWAIALQIPVVLMVGYRGWTRHGVNTDSAATYTERFLNAFGITYYRRDAGRRTAHLHRIEEARAHAAAGRGAFGRRVPRRQPPRGLSCSGPANIGRIFRAIEATRIVVPGRGGRALGADQPRPTGRRTATPMGGHAGFVLVGRSAPGPRGAFGSAGAC